MEYNNLVEQIETIAICQEVIAELIGASSEDAVNPKKVAIVLDFLAGQQGEFIIKLQEVLRNKATSTVTTVTT